MRKGENRTCSHCKQIFEAKFFPFQSIDNCVDCYEEIHNKTLHSFRKKRLGVTKENNDHGDLSAKILEILKKKPAKARDIATQLHVEKRYVNQELYYRLQNKCEKDKNHYWKIKSSRAKETKSSVTCPKCSSSMVMRKGKYGKFYGCKKYPFCKGTRDVFDLE